MPGSKKNFTGKYEKYNVDDEEDAMGLEDIRSNPIRRWEGARPFNEEVIAGKKYADALRSWESLQH